MTTAAPALPSSSVPPRPVAARTRMLLEAPLLPTLLRLSAPNILNLIAIAGLITFDGLYAARLGPDALAGVSLVFPWVMLVQHGAASGMGGAVSSAIARALGAGNRGRADALATHAVWLALLLSIISTGGMLAFGPAIYRWMGGSGAVLEYALAYSVAVFGASTAIWMLNLLCSVVRGTGNMTLPSVVILVCVAAHAVLSAGLMFGVGPVPALGVAGAGISLGLSFAAGTVFLIVRLRRQQAPLTLRFRDAPWQSDLLWEFLRVGIPGMTNVVINNLTVVALTALAAHFGRSAALAYSVGARLEYIIIPLGFGIGTAVVALVGTNLGAKQFARTRDAAWTGALLAAAVCGSTGLLFAAAPFLWLSIFTQDAEVSRIATSYLHIVGPAYALYGLAIGFYFACQGCGRLALAVGGNLLRLLLAAGCTWLAIRAQAGPEWMFASIAAGFVAYALLTSLAFSRILRGTQA